MTEQRMIEILHECTGMSEVDIENDEEIGALSALTAMQRAVDEQTATLRTEVERLKECEAIIREERERILYLKAREWVKDNPETYEPLT